MVIELEYITDITVPLKDGREKIIRKDVKIKKLFNIYSADVEEFVSMRTGKQVNKYSTVYYAGACYKVNMPYEKLKQIVLDKAIVVKGFAGHKK